MTIGWPPSSRTATSSEIRVRVDAFSKSSPIALPTRGRGALGGARVAFQRSAESNRATRPSVPRSVRLKRLRGMAGPSLQGSEDAVDDRGPFVELDEAHRERRRYSERQRAGHRDQQP